MKLVKNLFLYYFCDELKKTKHILVQRAIKYFRRRTLMLESIYNYLCFGENAFSSIANYLAARRR